MRSHNMEKFSTLSVLRSETTVCNEFFTCPVPQLQLHFTAMRVVLCDVNKDDEEVQSFEEKIYKSKNERLK